jgi:hypothetical protein
MSQRPPPPRHPIPRRGLRILPLPRPSENGTRPTSQVLYLCHLCGHQAEWPRAKTHTFSLPFGFSWSVTWQTPLVCSTCRMMRHPEVRKLGDGRRRFWKRAVALWVGEPYPSMDARTYRLLVLRLYLGYWWSRLRGRMFG